jgi:hypothetical protein
MAKTEGYSHMNDNVLNHCCQATESYAGKRKGPTNIRNALVAYSMLRRR